MTMTLDDADNFIEQLPDLETPEQVGAVFAEAIRPCGYLAVSAGEMKETPQGQDWQFFFNTWPVEWLMEYQRRDYVRHDLAPVLARVHAEPFTWREVFDQCNKTEKQSEFKNWIFEIGIRDGLCVPHHYPGEDLGLCVSVAGHPIDQGTERRAVHLASLYALKRCRELGLAKVESSSAKVAVSPREIECMKWVLEGKSDRDIGQILGISHTTAHFHVERAKKKLGVRTRTQAAKLLIALGYI
jgi:LuxR family quorum sensing-dependent transcriptional regulator